MPTWMFFWHLSSWCSRAFWINALVSYIILEILLFIGLLNILSLFLSWHLHHAYYIPFIIIPRYLNVLFFFFFWKVFILFAFQFGRFLLRYPSPKLRDSFLSYDQSTSQVIRYFSHFCCTSFISSFLSFFFFLISEFPSLCLPCLSAIVWHLFYPREHLAY